MILSVGCMGIEVNRAFPSNDIIHSSGSTVISFILCMKSWLFLT